MTGPLKNARQERFVEEYLLDFHARRAAAAAGVDLKPFGDGFYVYFLIDDRDGSIFYVGKGKGGRLLSHRRHAANPNSTNQVKAQRIVDCGEALVEVVFADGLDEVSAFRLEKELISALSTAGLTNIAAGSVHPLESVLASIDRSMLLIRTYDDWIATAHLSRLDAARQLSGSTEAFYADFVRRFREMRLNVARDLNSIKEKSSGAARR